jgi:hypothetical protein
VKVWLQFILAPKGDCVCFFKISKNLKGNPMKSSKLYEALHALIGERVPLHIWGACGVGKSQIVHQVADDLDYTFSMYGRCNSIPLIYAVCRAFRLIRPSGFRPGFFPLPAKAFSFSMSLPRLGR